MYVKLSVCTMEGRKIENPANGYHISGLHNITWDVSKLTSGIYFLLLESGNTITFRKCVKKGNV
ncbi:MAG: T9SS type A sorting domain-containing protein [Bacteroidales bacterium]|jgi:hypothetical protein